MLEATQNQLGMNSNHNILSFSYFKKLHDELTATFRLVKVEAFDFKPIVLVFASRVEVAFQSPVAVVFRVEVVFKLTLL